MEISGQQVQRGGIIDDFLIEDVGIKEVSELLR